MSFKSPVYFDAKWYVARYPDIAAQQMDPLDHFMRYGRFEGRNPCYPMAAALEHDLWRGKSADVLPLLKQLVVNGTGADCIWAAWACGRWAAAQNDWATAIRFLNDLEPDDITNAFQIPSFALLAIETALVAKNIPRANLLYRNAIKIFGYQSEFILVGAAIKAAEYGYNKSWSWRIRALYARSGLAGFELGGSNNKAAAFDRLQTATFPGFDRPRLSLPLVSVIMPVFNAEDTIATALRGLCEQSWKALEILVVDNGSSDQTVEIIEKRVGYDARIRLIDGSKEQGAYAARNIGLAAAQGEFITVHDADDWSHRRKIELQARALLKNPQYQASTSQWVRATNDLRFTNCLTDVSLIHMNISALMFRRCVFDTLGYWDKVRMAADTEYYQRILQVFGPAAIKNVVTRLPLAFGRQSSSSLTQDPKTGMMSQFHGPRFDYKIAFEQWHKQSSSELYMPMHPKTRPFDIAPEMRTNA